jgi:superfamily II DNA or RNA helicase
VKLKSAFEWADTGPNAGETGWDPPQVWRPGKLKRSEFTETAPGVNPEAARGVAREPEEKVSQYDDAIFSGDPTRLMPHLKAIHKLGGISDSEVGIEDLDALKTTGRDYARQAQRAFTNPPTAGAPAPAPPHDSKSTADGGNEPDTAEEIPIEEPEAGNDTKSLFRKNIKGLQKRAAGILDLELLPHMPRLDTIAREQQRQLLSQAVYEARNRGGELRGGEEPASIAMAGQKALEGAQYARLADADVDAVNARLARRALEKRSGWAPWLEAESLTGRIVRREALEKEAAELKTELLPHQQRVVDRISKQRGLVVAHGLGSGKTLSSIAAAVQLEPDKTKVLVPASLRANYQKELQKHVEGALPIEVGSLQGAAVRGEIPRADLLVVDEAHRGRNPQSKTYQMIQGAEAGKRLLLTASPTYNRPSDVAALVNMAAGDKIMPLGSSFDKQYIAQPKKGIWGLMPWARKQEGLKRKGELKKVLTQWVDYHKSGGEGFPDVEEERHAVKMTKRQTQLHDAAWDQLSLLSKLRLRRGLPPDKQDLSKINNFQSQTRQISSTESPYSKGKTEVSPKIVKAVGLLDTEAKANPDHRALVYSNYLGTLRDYSKELKKRDIPHAIFSGQQKMRDRKQMVEDYNSGKLKALLVSSAGGEGLDLKGTRQVQVLEPHWNVEKLKQVEGRAIRRGSHEHLPKDQQTVKLQRFESYPRGGIFTKRRGVEQVLGDMATNKERLNQELISLMDKQGGVVDNLLGKVLGPAGYVGLTNAVHSPAAAGVARHVAKGVVSGDPTRFIRAGGHLIAKSPAARKAVKTVAKKGADVAVGGLESLGRSASYGLGGMPKLMSFEDALAKTKTAEPPPPEGVSSKEWDKHLEGAKDEGFGLQGSTEVQGIPIAIENRKGSVRKGKDRDGNEWRTKMQHPYGYIVGSKGADGEGVDAYVGPDKAAPKAFVVHQKDKETGKYDEDKVMLGFRTKADAKQAFLAHYDSPKFLGPIKTVPIERLRELVESKKRLVKISFAMPAVEDKSYQKKVRQRFGKLETALKEHGDPLGTGHKRILIPKRIMKEDDLIGQLGFVPVKVAIPETGQTRFESFRHPDNLFHLHEHGDAWIMHKDDHPASTMLMKKWQMARDAIKKAPGKSQEEINKALKATGGSLKPVGDFIRGLPHVVTEGIPGAYYYLKGKVVQGQPMRERLEQVTPPSYKRQIKRWVEMKKAASAEYASLGTLAQ